MGFNPLQEKGIPIEKQIRNWSALNGKPYDKNQVDPYTRCRVILMNGIEVESVMFGHQMNRNPLPMELKPQLAMVRRVEQQQQKAVSGLVPADESVLENTIGYEQVAVDLTSELAQSEPDPYVKAALDFALLEDFDHLYRYANLLEMTQGISADNLVNGYTEIFPGRPTIVEHRHPFDSVRMHYDKNKADPLTKLHVLTITAAEQQTMNYYMNVANRPNIEIGRGLYQEIGMIEEQHVSHYESLADPTESWFECLLMHEYNECYLYYSCMESEKDPRIRRIWQQHLEQEITHLQMARDLMRQYEKRDAEELLPAEFPRLTTFHPNKEYVRQVVAEQVDLTAKDMEFVPMEEAPERYHEYQSMVNMNGDTPSQKVVEMNIEENGRDYRLETEGEHPVERLRAREMVTV